MDYYKNKMKTQDATQDSTTHKNCVESGIYFGAKYFSKSIHTKISKKFMETYIMKFQTFCNNMTLSFRMYLFMHLLERQEDRDSPSASSMPKCS